MRAVNSVNQNVLVNNLVVADNLKTRLVGLIGKKTFTEGEGMLIKHSGNSIHTFFMSFPIDLAFVDKKGTVRWMYKNAAQWRIFIAPLFVSTDCLELPAGTLEKTQTKIGDTIRVES